MEPTLAQRVGDGLRVAVMASRKQPADSPAARWIVMPKTPGEYARRLYADLRALDIGGFDWLLVEAVPDTVPWRAIADRLRRACR
ncbi:MAG: Sua5 family C-terminal domain-containing protein [Wenzhouxiangellaceae bacterium]